MGASLLFVLLFQTLLGNLQGAQKGQLEVTFAVPVSQHQSLETTDLLDIGGLAV